MSFQKRVFDLVLAFALIILFAPCITALSAWLLLRQGRPVFFRGERMKTHDEAFTLYKFRSMDAQMPDCGVTGGEKHSCITRDGHWLRRSRLDELPQLWNILIGDISFVGPRPPMREFVERFPEIYRAVLKNRPGVTGLATLTCHQYEDQLLRKTSSAQETDALYVARCLPRKARIDLIYQRRASMLLDLALILRTAGKWVGISPRNRLWRLTKQWKHDSTKPFSLGREKATWRVEYF